MEDIHLIAFIFCGRKGPEEIAYTGLSYNLHEKTKKPSWIEEIHLKTRSQINLNQYYFKWIPSIQLFSWSSFSLGTIKTCANEMPHDQKLDVPHFVSMEALSVMQALPPRSIPRWDPTQTASTRNSRNDRSVYYNETCQKNTQELCTKLFGAVYLLRVIFSIVLASCQNFT